MPLNQKFTVAQTQHTFKPRGVLQGPWSMSSASSCPSCYPLLMRPLGSSCYAGASSVLQPVRGQRAGWPPAACRAVSVPASLRPTWPAPASAFGPKSAGRLNPRRSGEATCTFPPAAPSTKAQRCCAPSYLCPVSGSSSAEWFSHSEIHTHAAHNWKPAKTQRRHRETTLEQLERNKHVIICL